MIGDDGGLNLIPIPETGRLINELLYTSIGWLYLPYFVEIRLEVLKSQFQAEVRQRSVVGRLREINKRILLRAMSTVKDSGVRLVVLGALNNPKRQELEAFCKEHKISYMHYELSGPKAKWVLAPSDHHYNRQATMAIADQIEPQLRMLITSKGAITEDKSP